MSYIQMGGFPLFEIVSGSPEETESLGERIAGQLGYGAVVALRGGLGSGKTCLSKGIVRGLGVTERVTSPTYTIVSEYAGRCPVYHIDAYRLSGDEDFESAGAGECIGGGVSIIEWSERVPRSIPPDAVVISIEIIGPGERRIRIEGLEPPK